MATGNYGTIRPADVSVDDVEIFYSYTPNRESLIDVELIPLDPAEVLVPANNPDNNTEIFLLLVYFHLLIPCFMFTC